LLLSKKGDWPRTRTSSRGVWVPAFTGTTMPGHNQEQ
jgi:hypothetical protein